LKVSVIIPTYNTANLVGQAIESVHNSSYKNFEIIVVDDGSTDNTKQIIDALKQTFEFTYIYQNNKGLAGARNTGIENASGDFLVFLDSDDLVLPTKFQLQIDFFSKNINADAVYSFSDCFVEDDANNRFNIGLPVFEGNVLNNLLFGNFMHVNSLMVKTSKVREVGLFNPLYKELEDWDLWLRMSLNGSQFYCIKEVLSLVRVRKGSMTTNQDKMNKAMDKVLSNLETKFIVQHSNKSLILNFFRALLGFKVLANSSDFYSTFFRALKICGLSSLVSFAKIFMKKLIFYFYRPSNTTTNQLEQVWNAK
jgi:glycosyltransferase involved in cell wall biosynthesis